MIPDFDEKVQIGSAKSKAFSVMSKALIKLETIVETVDRPKELASVAESMGKIINNTSVKVEERVNLGTIVIYAPQVASLESFETIDIQETEQS